MSVSDAFKKAGNFCWDTIRGERLTLLNALEKGDWGKAGAMLQQTPDAADWDLQGPTPIVRKALHVAAASGDFNTLSILLRPEFFNIGSIGGNIDIKDSEGATPLILAARTGNDMMLKALIAKGADVNAVDSHGRSAISNATDNARLVSVMLLHAAGADINGPKGGRRPAIAAAHSDMGMPVLKYLIANGADIDSPGERDETPLQTCWNMPNWEAFGELLRAGANPNSHGASRGAQLLRWTIMANNAEATEKLLKAGADPTAPTCRDTSVIDEAYAEGRNPVITAMIVRRVQQLEAKRNTEAAIKEMTAGTSAAISVKRIKLRLS